MDVDDLRARHVDGTDVTPVPDGLCAVAVAAPSAAPAETAAGHRGTAAGPGPAGRDDVPLRISLSVEQARLILSGDIDEATYGGLTAALSSVAEVPGTIHVDLGGVRFCDVAGLRALVLLAGDGAPAEGPDRHVVLHTVPAHLKTLLRILGWDCVPGLVID